MVQRRRGLVLCFERPLDVAETHLLNVNIGMYIKTDLNGKITQIKVIKSNFLAV